MKHAATSLRVIMNATCKNINEAFIATYPTFEKINGGYVIINATYKNRDGAFIAI